MILSMRLITRTVMFALAAQIWIVFAASATPTTKNFPQEGIGTVKMLTNGTLLFHLRDKTDGKVADSIFSIRSSDPRYQKYLTHVGDMKPGDEKAVQPW